MVAAITAAVSGDRPERRRALARLALVHFAGLTIGALALAGIVLAASFASPRTGWELVAALGVATTLWGGAALVGRPLAVASFRQQVPLAWRYTMAPSEYAFSYGVGLGLGVLTHIPSLSTYAFVGFIFLSKSAWVGLTIALLYAVARVVPVVIAARSDRSAEQLVELGASWHTVALRTDGLVLMLVGVALIVQSLSGFGFSFHVT